MKITDEDWEQLSDADFDTSALFNAVDSLDKMRSNLNAGEEDQPPALRTDLLRLHTLASAVLNDGVRSKVPQLFELAGDIEDQVQDLASLLEQVQETLDQLTTLVPESLSYGALDDE